MGSCLQCRGASAIWFVDAYFCLAMLHAWTLEYQHMMLCV